MTNEREDSNRALRFVRDWWPVFGVGPAYIIAIWLYRKTFDGGLSSKPEIWGQFGDYIGGLLNPIVAVLALVMLIVSVSIQRREMRDTTNALKGQHELMQRQLFESQFYSTLTFLVQRLDAAKSMSMSKVIANEVMDASIKPAAKRLRALAESTEQITSISAPIVSLIKLASNAITGAEKILSPLEIEHYASTLRGFISGFESGVLLAAMQGDPPGSPLEVAVNKFRLLESLPKLIRQRLWASPDRTTTLINRLSGTLGQDIDL